MCRQRAVRSPLESRQEKWKAIHQCTCRCRRKLGASNLWNRGSCSCRSETPQRLSVRRRCAAEGGGCSGVRDTPQGRVGRDVTSWAAPLRTTTRARPEGVAGPNNGRSSFPSCSGHRSCCGDLPRQPSAGPTQAGHPPAPASSAALVPQRLQGDSAVVPISRMLRGSKPAAGVINSNNLFLLPQRWKSPPCQVPAGARGLCRRAARPHQGSSLP